ncbi:MAG: ATP-binding protein [Lachnospiraceae bacterium]|nr:ATP-binding protein [Lachnospiraceae bacterium]
MSDLLSEILILFFEVLCSKIFYETFGKVRNKGWINIAQLILLESSVLVVASALSNIFLLKQIVVASIYALFMFWHVKVSIRKSFILALLYQAILLSTDYLAYAINNELKLGSNVVGNQYNLENVLVILLAKALVFLCVLIIKKQLGEKSTEILVDADWLKLLIFPIFTIIIITSMLSFIKHVETSEQTMLLFIGAFAMIGMNIVVFYLINDIVERETRLYENRIFQLQAKRQVEKYELISENFDKQKKRTHEYKNQIECVESLLEKKEYVKLEEYVKGICGRLDKELDAIDTNNVIVNAILNTKYQEAEANGIVFVLRVNDLSKLRIADEDIVTILSNLMNNAIEACKKCDSSRRILKLKFVNEDGMIKIGVRNTFNNPILYENGEIKSTKMLQAEEHGVGIRNIIEVIEKYDGSYVIKDDNQEFYFSIIISD